MRRSTKTAVLFSALVAMTPLATSSAQLSLGLAAGPAMPQGNYADVVNTGFTGLATLAIGVPLMPFDLRVDGAYNRFSIKRPTGVTADLGAERVTSITVNPTFSLPLPLSPVKPYLIAGGGSYNIGCTGKASCTSQSHFGWNAGAGVRVGLLGFHGFAEARYHRVSINNSAVQYLPVTFGMMF